MSDKHGEGLFGTSGNISESEDAESREANTASDSLGATERSAQTTPGAAGEGQQAGTPYGWDSSSTTPDGVDQWINGSDNRPNFEGERGASGTAQAEAPPEDDGKASDQGDTGVYSPT